MARAGHRCARRRLRVALRRCVALARGTRELHVTIYTLLDRQQRRVAAGAFREAMASALADAIVVSPGDN